MNNNACNIVEVKQQLKQRVLEKVSMRGELSDEELTDIINKEILDYKSENFLTIQEKITLGKELFNSLRKLDILQDLLEDEDVTEIMINGASHIFVEKKGTLIRYPSSFESESRLKEVIQTIVSKSNRIVNESVPIVDSRLEDGSRINIVLPPVALNGPILTIRKFSREPMTMENLIGYGALTEEISEFLHVLVEAKYNIFISGGTGSGKTTFLNALSNFIPKDERIITIEDSAELQLHSIPNLVRLECRNANLEGKNEITIRDLIKSSLRMRPDRIIVGEIRDSAAIDLLSAYNTGHDGSLSTGHANSVKDMLSRLETLVLQGVEMPVQAIRRQIASAIDIIVHLGRMRDKSRKVLEISEVLDVVGDEIIINPIYQFQLNEKCDGSSIGKLVRTKNKLIQTEKLRRAGLMLNEEKVRMEKEE